MAACPGGGEPRSPQRERPRGAGGQPKTHWFCPGDTCSPEPNCALGSLSANKPSQPPNQPCPAKSLQFWSLQSHPPWHERATQRTCSLQTSSPLEQGLGWSTAAGGLPQGQAAGAAVGRVAVGRVAVGRTPRAQLGSWHGRSPAPSPAPFPAESAESTQRPEQTHRAAGSEGRVCCCRRPLNI